MTQLLKGKNSFPNEDTNHGLQGFHNGRRDFSVGLCGNSRRDRDRNGRGSDGRRRRSSSFGGRARRGAQRDDDVAALFFYGRGELAELFVIFGADRRENDSHAEARLGCDDLAESVNDCFAGIHGNFDGRAFRKRREHFNVTPVERNVGNAAGQADGGVFGRNDRFNAAGLARIFAALFAGPAGGCAVFGAIEGSVRLRLSGRPARVIVVRRRFGERSIPNEFARLQAAKTSESCARRSLLTDPLHAVDGFAAAIFEFDFRAERADAVQPGSRMRRNR